MSRRPGRGSWLLLAPVLLGCATTAPAPLPDWEDPTVAEALADRAARACEMRGLPDGPPARPFRTDVCTFSLDGSWGDCCVEHDIVYWCGGSRAERLEADRKLRTCAAERVRGCRGAALGLLLQGGTFFGGAPWLPTPWRWGYGHPFPAGYASRKVVPERTPNGR